MTKTKEQISYNMRRVRGQGSRIELLLRQALRERGLRYRKNVRDIFGKPDIAFLKERVAIFCDSEFWHGHDWENRRSDFKSNTAFWVEKIERNMARDAEVNARLAEDGWIVLRFRGREIEDDVARCADIVQTTLSRVRP